MFRETESKASGVSLPASLPAMWLVLLVGFVAIELTVAAFSKQRHTFGVVVVVVRACALSIGCAVGACPCLFELLEWIRHICDPFAVATCLT